MSVMLALVLLWQQPAEPLEAQPRRAMPLLERIAQRAAETVGGDDAWGELHAELVPALIQVFERNGWTSESDRFALDLTIDVGTIPPWDLDGRMEVFRARVGERYGLDAEQEEVLLALAAREFQHFFVRHAAQLMPHMLEALQTRVAGEPFTPEQVARWAEDFAPLMVEARERFERNSAEFVEVLTPEQRAVVTQDLAAARRRMERMEQLGTSWAEGDWDPADWGLDQDPIQTGTARSPAAQHVDTATADAPAASGAAPARPSASSDKPRPDAPATQPAPAPEDNDPWAVYVREFIQRYLLTEQQQRRAWIIHDSARARRAIVDERHRRRTERLASADPPTDRVNRLMAEAERAHATLVETLFTDLKRRLDRLPTRTQRATAEPHVPAAPAPATAPARPVP